MLKTAFSVILSAAALLTSAARADEPRIHGYAMTGYSDTVGTTANYLQGGYILGGGVSVAPAWSLPLDFRFEATYSLHNASIALLNSGQQATNQPIDSGTGTVWAGTANAAYHIPIIYGVRAYGIAGIGVYHTRIELDQTLPYYGGGYGYGYDYGYGYGFGDYGYGYAEAQVAAHGVTNFGWNAGAGVEFDLPSGHSWFIESRYTHINSRTAVQLIPIEIGFRF